MSINSEVSKNPNGEINAKLTASHTIGDPNHNLTGGVFAAATTNNPKVTTGAFADYNINGHGLSVSKINTGTANITSGMAHTQLYKDNTHNLTANAFKTHTSLQNGFSYDQVGGGLNYDHVNRHGASISANQIPQIGGTTFDTSVRTNIWTSKNNAGSLDAFGSASKTFGGHFDGQKNFKSGISYNHKF